MLATVATLRAFDGFVAFCAQFDTIAYPSPGNACDLIVKAVKGPVDYDEKVKTQRGYDMRGLTCDLVEFAPGHIKEQVSLK